MENQFHFCNSMIRSLVLLFTFFVGIPTGWSATVAWWRFSPDDSYASEGVNSMLEWWPGQNGDCAIAWSEDVPPASMYAAQIKGAGNSFDALRAYNSESDVRICALYGEKGTRLISLEKGFAAEGFFRSLASDAQRPLRQVIWSIGDGWANISVWFGLEKGVPTLGVRTEPGENANRQRIQVPAANDAVHQGWCYFRVLVKDGDINILIVGQDGEKYTASAEGFSGMVDGETSKTTALLIGRSSVFWSDDQSYQGSIDPFFGLIADLRFSDSKGPDDGGLVK